MHDDSKKAPSGTKVFYRKLRYLNHRGTLFNKTPRSVRKETSRKSKRTFLQMFRCLRFTLMSRYRRLYNFQLKISTENALTTLSVDGTVTVIPEKVVEKKISKKERIVRFNRLAKFLNTKRKLKKSNQKIINSRKLKIWDIRYRKIRYLYHTDQLFKIDREKSIEYFERKIGFARQNEHRIITANSTALFILAYLFVYLAKQYVVALASFSFDIETIIYYYDIDFLIRGTEWTPDAVKVIFTVGPLTTFLIALLSLIVFVQYLDRTWIARTFFLWVFCHSLIHFLGDVMAGTFMNQSFGWVLMYMYFMDTGKMIVSFVSIILLVAAGLFISNYFLFTGNTYYNYLIDNQRNKFVFSHIVSPFILGNLLIMAIKYPGMTVLELVINWSMVLLILPAIIRSRFSNELFFEEEPKKIHLFYRWILTCIILLPLFRIIFGIGVRF